MEQEKEILVWNRKKKYYDGTGKRNIMMEPEKEIL